MGKCTKLTTLIHLKSHPLKCQNLLHKNLLNKKKGRATNCSTKNDMLLVSTWRDISIDTMRGSNLTHQTYWKSIAAFYDKNKVFSSDWRTDSLSH